MKKYKIDLEGVLLCIFGFVLFAIGGFMYVNGDKGFQFMGMIFGACGFTIVALTYFNILLLKNVTKK